MTTHTIDSNSTNLKNSSATKSSPHGTPFDQQRSIPGINHIVAVASGKGGVGKSTIASNLALALQKSGAKVGLLDADIYGPSIPRMWGTLNQRPEVGTNQKIQPLSRFGVKLMSIGFLVDEATAVVWRGPMLFKALDQFLRDVEWGELDYLVIDMPPGTGDIQLSLVQKVPVSGIVTVTTPQNVALADVKKSMDMFKRVAVPMLGLVENMSYFQNGERGERVQLFPKGDLERFLKSEGIEKLGEVSFNPSIGVSCEIGIPFAETGMPTSDGKEFERIVEKIRKRLPV